MISKKTLFVWTSVESAVENNEEKKRRDAKLEKKLEKKRYKKDMIQTNTIIINAAWDLKGCVGKSTIGDGKQQLIVKLQHASRDSKQNEVQLFCFESCSSLAFNDMLENSVSKKAKDPESPGFCWPQPIQLGSWASQEMMRKINNWLNQSSNLNGKTLFEQFLK